MILDIVLLIIVLLAALYGAKKGFVFTLIHTCGTVGALAIAFFVTSPAMSYIKANTGLYYAIHENFSSHFSGKLAASNTAISVLPSGLQPYVSNISENVVKSLADSFSGIAFAIIVYLGLFIAVKLVLWLILRLLSKGYNDGVAGFADGMFGFLLGCVKGMVFVFIILALLIPVASLLSPDMTQTVIDQLDASRVSKILYDNNLLVMLLEGFFA